MLTCFWFHCFCSPPKSQFPSEYLPHLTVNLHTTVLLPVFENKRHSHHINLYIYMHTDHKTVNDNFTTNSICILSELSIVERRDSTKIHNSSDSTGQFGLACRTCAGGSFASTWSTYTSSSLVCLISEEIITFPIDCIHKNETTNYSNTVRYSWNDTLQNVNHDV